MSTEGMQALGKPSWRELIEEREQAERLERERQLEEGRKAWAKIKEQVNNIDPNDLKFERKFT